MVECPERQDFARAVEGRQIRRKLKTKYILEDRRIRSATNRFELGQLTVREFLFCVSHSSDSFVNRACIVAANDDEDEVQEHLIAPMACTCKSPPHRSTSRYSTTSSTGPTQWPHVPFKWSLAKVHHLPWCTTSHYITAMLSFSLLPVMCWNLGSAGQ